MGRDTTTSYKVSEGKGFTSISCTDSILNKMLNCKAIICVVLTIFCLCVLAAIGIGIAAIVIYEKNDSSDFDDCNAVNYKNVYYIRSKDLTNDCLDYYNITKVFVVGTDNTIISDCVFEIDDGEDQLILNKLNQTSTILNDWVTQELRILVTDKDVDEGPAMLFAYLVYIGYTTDDASALIQKIPDVDISYNFMQQIKLYAYSFQTGEVINDDEQALLWSNTNNLVSCMDI